MKKGILALMVGLLIAFSTNAAENGIKKFIGTWKVNCEKTLLEAKKSPKYKPEDEERMKKAIEKMLKSMTLVIKEKELIFDMGKRKQALKSIKVENKNDTLIMFFEVGKKKNKFQVTFSIVENRFLNFKSTASDDMNFYIWEKGKGDSKITESEILIEAIKEEKKK